MPILTKEVEVKLWGNNIKHYHNLGYNGKRGDIIIVKVEDLPRNSHIKVDVLCDICMKKSNTIPYYSYINSIENSGNYSCIECLPIKVKQIVNEKYGVDNVAQLEEVKERMRQTNLERYGVEYYNKTEECKEKISNTCKAKYGYDHALQSPFIQQKIKNSLIEHYGVDNPMKSEECKLHLQESMLEKYGVNNCCYLDFVKDKCKETTLKNYGVEHHMYSPDIKEKIKQTNIDKYGYDNVFKNEEVRNKYKKSMKEKYGNEHPMHIKEFQEKMRKTLYENQKAPTSKQQLYIYTLYKSKFTESIIELNYPISYYNADICFLKEKLDIEIDCGGHNLSVKIGQLTQEEFDQKEIVRNNIIKREGYKQMRIISRKDNIPSDKVLLEMLAFANNYFSTTCHSWVTYDIDNSLLFSAQHKQGIPYSFGILRTIKDSDLNKTS